MFPDRFRNTIALLALLLIVLAVGSAYAPPFARFAVFTVTVVLAVGLILGCVWYLLAQQQER